MKQELTKTEVDQIQVRINLAQNKMTEMQRLKMEHQIMQDSARVYVNTLIPKYKLDAKKKWDFDGTSLVEAEEPEVAVKKDKK